VTMGIPRNSPIPRRWASPETIAAALPATAVASTMSSSGSARITGPISAGSTSSTSAAYPSNRSAASTPCSANLTVNFFRNSTSCGSPKSGTLEMICTVPAAAASISCPGTPPQMRPDTAVFVSSTSRTSPLRTIRLDFGFDFLGRQGRRSGGRELLARHLHLRDAGRREPFAQDRLDRSGFKQAFGRSLLGEGVGNRDLDGGHGWLFRGQSRLYARNGADWIHHPCGQTLQR